MSGARLLVARKLIVELVMLFGIFALITHFGSAESWTSSAMEAIVYAVITAPFFTWLGVRRRRRGAGRVRLRDEWAVEQHSADAWTAYAVGFAVLTGLCLAAFKGAPATPNEVIGLVFFGLLAVECAVQAVRARRRVSGDRT